MLQLHTLKEIIHCGATYHVGATQQDIQETHGATLMRLLLMTALL
jgi:hypothetical protein